MVRTIVLATVVTAGVLALLFYLGVDDGVGRQLAWLANARTTPLLFLLIMASVVVLLLPGIVFTTGAGFLFGVGPGAAYVVVGTTLGSALAFLIARYALGERAQRSILRHARVRALSEEVALQGWKIVLLTRLIPFFPGKAMNYGFGLTRISLAEFVAGTFVGIIPFSVHNAYLGSLAANLYALQERPQLHGPMEWVFMGIGLILLAGGVVVLGRMAQRALARASEGHEA